jgi:hypothetical protein
MIVFVVVIVAAAVAAAGNFATCNRLLKLVV